MRSFPSSRNLLLAIALALGVVLLCTHPTLSFARPAVVEPPLEFQLQVGTQSVPVALDEEFTVTLGGEVVRMTLTVAPDRLFDNTDGVRFRYPKNMAFAYDGSAPDVKIWTMDGGDCVLMLFRFEDPGMEVDEVSVTVLEQLVSTFGRGNTEVSKRKLVLGGRTLECSRLVARIVGESIVQELVAFAHGKDVCVLSMQDSPTDSGESTKEYREILALLARTFEFPE